VQLVAASRVAAAVKGLIYSKIFRVSSATNKKFKKGDLINLLTEDAGKINA
jgi:ABC-type transport system involved in cytochrome bd biosynthesis fused ATPase/permease subunit